MNYPLLKAKQNEYGDPRCPLCSAEISRTTGYARMSMGSIYYNKKIDGGGPHPAMRMYWHMSYMGPYTMLTAGPYSNINIADAVEEGQAEFFFCSTACLRKFLNQLVDDVEAGIKQPAKNPPA